MDSLVNLIRTCVEPAVDITIHLGPINFRLVSDVRDFTGQQYFSSQARSAYAEETVDFELWCLSLSAIDLDIDYILPHVDKTCRGKSFAVGYYVTDHFGPPVYLITRGRHYYLLGEKPERVVWPYFVKYFLMLHTLSAQSLHLKAAACAVDGVGTLLLGRGGAGKTVFLTQLCLHGAQFLSNSHSIVKNGYVSGIASSIRIRPGPWFEDLINSVKTSPALLPGELIIDPYDAFAANTTSTTPLRNVCVLDFKEGGQHIIRMMSKQEAYDYAEQFSLAINVYRLEEDLLDLYNGDYGNFSLAYTRMKEQLGQLIQESNCYYVSSDLLNPMHRDDVLTLLGGK